MPSTKDEIFRSKALQHYIQNREKTILPRFVAPPVFVFLWILFVLLFCAGIMVWVGRIPLYMTASGVVLPQQAARGDDAMAIVFVPPTAPPQLQPGLRANIQIGVKGPQLTTTITKVEPGILSPQQVYQRYALTVPEPSRIVWISLKGISGQMYSRSIVQVQFQIGSRRLLSLFPLFDTLLKDA